MTNTLHLDLHREFSTQFAVGTKPSAYRSHTPCWRRQLEGGDYDVVQSHLHFVLAGQVRTGYATKAPEMRVEFRDLRCYVNGRTGYYAIRGAPILTIKRWRG